MPRDFDASYAATPPWEIGRPQAPILALARTGALRGVVLDAGCGTGEHALLAAARGLVATGIDSAPAAIDIARAKANERGLTARFVVGDALCLSELGDQYDTIIDCGLFHNLLDADRARYVVSLTAVSRPGAQVILLCFSDRHPGDKGPRRISQAEIRDAFASYGRVDWIRAAAFERARPALAAYAWLARVVRE